jgi:hypothetical protein
VAGIFISYRRDDSRYQARLIYDALTKVLPRDHAMDNRKLCVSRLARRLLEQHRQPQQQCRFRLASTLHPIP